MRGKAQSFWSTFIAEMREVFIKCKHLIYTNLEQLDHSEIRNKMFVNIYVKAFWFTWYGMLLVAITVIPKLLWP